MSAPRGLGALLAEELRGLGLAVRPAGPGGVYLGGGLEAAYRVCLWSRIASRVRWPLARLAAPSPEALHAAAVALPWEDHLEEGGTLAVRCDGSAPWLRHPHFGALTLKDAVVDRLRARRGTRPSVSRDEPGLGLHLRLDGDRATVAVELSAGALHRRGYRGPAGPAPLKENVAAAVLQLAGWPAMARTGGAFVDPLCGSGTLLVEAALMAADIAPGLLGAGPGSPAWGGHRPALWRELAAEARARREAGLARLPPLLGRDLDPAAVEATRANLEAAGLAGRVSVETGPLETLEPPMGARPGLVACNPPWGRRLGEAGPVRSALGAILDRRFAGWEVAVLLAADPHEGLGLGEREALRLEVGGIPCRVLRVRIPGSPDPIPGSKGPDGADLANRLAKQLAHLRRWARREGVGAYRIYDADLPEFAFAVDLYESGEERWAVVAEYAPPRSVDPALAAARRGIALERVAEILAVPPERVVGKSRRRQRRGEEYGPTPAGEPLVVEESGCRFLVELHGHLDTGLFLHSRGVRALVRELGPRRRFLNLFAYTATATVQAAAGGTSESLSVDLSPGYAAWGERNLALNGLDPERHRYRVADCLPWLEEEGPEAGPFDLVLLDPPTFSRSKRMRGTFDIQRDHPRLLAALRPLLAPDGVVVFTVHRTGFRLHPQGFEGWHHEDASAGTLPRDFQRRPAGHRCWLLRPEVGPGGASPSSCEGRADPPARLSPASGRGPQRKGPTP